MKRFAAMVTIVVLVLAMSAGTAFANVCPGGTCDGRMMVCAPASSTACPMGGGAVMTHSGCSHSDDTGARDVVSPQTGLEFGVVSAPLAVVPPLAGPSGLASLLPMRDARGAPHLTTVSRT
jgi:hypothetical protein